MQYTIISHDRDEGEMTKYLLENHDDAYDFLHNIFRNFFVQVQIIMILLIL